MSFHSSLMSVTGWPADLVTAGIVTSTDQVVPGRRPNNVLRRDLTLWIERKDDVPGGEGGNGAQFLKGHVYVVHVLFPLNLGGNKAGKVQLDTIEAKLEAIRDRYHGASMPAAIVTAVPALANIVSASAVEEAVDEDPEDEAVQSGAVRVTWWEKE